MTKGVKAQLVIFTILTMVGLLVMATVYLKLPRMAGYNRTDVTLQMPVTGGLYQNANVSYLGKVVGQVKEVTLTKGGVEAQLHIDSNAGIPADSVAEVRSVSAIGEQYVDFVPGADAGPEILADGAIITADRVRMPQGIGSVLDQSTALLASVDNDKLRRVLAEAFTAFEGSDQDLQKLLDSSRLLISEASANADETKTLIADLEPLLDSQLESSKDIKAWTRNLASITEQLRSNEPEITGIFESGPSSFQRINETLDQLEPTMPILMANMISLGEVGVIYNRSIEQILVLYPALVSALVTSINEGKSTKSVKVDFNLQINSSPACTTGFLPATERRSPNDTSLGALFTDKYCKVPKDQFTSVRGSRNFPCMEFPGKRAASPEKCRDTAPYVPEGINPPDNSELGGTTPAPGFQYSGPGAYDAPDQQQGQGASNRGISYNGGLATTTVPYNAETGEYVASDGQTYRAGNFGTRKTEAAKNLTGLMTNGVT